MFWIAWLLATALAADPACPGAPDSSNDTDADGFVDACVDPSTSVGAGATIGAATTVDSGGSVGSGAVLGPNLTVGNGVTIGARAVLTGGATESVLGAGGAIGRRATLDGTFSLGPTAAIARATTLGDGLSAGHTFSVGYGAVAGADLDAGDRVTLGNLATLGASVTLGTGARVGRDALIQDGAWLGEDVSVGPGAQVASSVADPTRLHDAAVVRRGGRVAVGAELWDGATVGRDAEVRAGATIGVGAVVRSMAVVLAGAAVPDLAVIPRGNRYPPPSYDAPQPTWATPPPPPGTGLGELVAVAVHPNGDLVSGGMIFGTGIDGVPSLGARDAYVRVSTGTGALVWSDTFDGPSADQLYEVAVLDGGDILGVGYTEGSLPGFTGNSNDSGILGRWSASGERRFVDQTTSLGVRRLHAVCSDGTGGFYVGGYADGWYAQQNTSGDAVVMRYDAENVRQWVIRPRVAGFEVVHALAPRPGGGVYVLGATQGAPAGWTFLGGGNDGFIEVLDPQGNRIDYAQFGSADYEYIYGLDVSETGLIAISGHTGGSLPGHTDASPGSASAFVAVLNADLDTQWIVQLDTLAISTLPSVAWDAQGRLHAVGLVSESFAGHPYGGLRDQLHLVFDAAGNLLHSAQYGGPNDDEFEDVDIAADGDVVIAGDRIFTGYNTQGDLVRLPNPN